MVRVLLLQLILLCCKRVFVFFSFALEWATDAEEEMECVRPPDVKCGTRVLLYFYNQRGLACVRCSVGLRRGKEQEIIVLMIFFFS